MDFGSNHNNHFYNIIMNAIKDFFGKFNQVICINLPNDHERNNYIVKLFNGLGVVAPVFFSATSQEDEIVDKYYKAGLVKKFPTCFRCGKNACGRNDCNNVLIRPQVATYITYMRVWEYLVNSEINSLLILEDDIVFSQDAYNKCEQIVKNKLIENTGINQKDPVLIRFGWALCEDHSSLNAAEMIPDMIKMSNPCFAINRAMAQKLITGCPGITTTVDIYLHRHVGSVVKNFTIMPPLFYEKSWSTGEFKSHINPKKIYLDYIKQHYDTSTDKYLLEKNRLDKHVNHINFHELLLLGLIGCGSENLCELLHSLDIEIGNEELKGYGISSWMLVVNDDEYPCKKTSIEGILRSNYFKRKICIVLNPVDAIQNIMTIMKSNKDAGPYFSFIRKHVFREFNIDIDSFDSPFQKAVASYIFWYKIILMQGVDKIIRVEYDVFNLMKFMVKCEMITFLFLIKTLLKSKLNSCNLKMEHAVNEEIGSEWFDLPPILACGLNNICSQLGYKSPCQIGG